MEAANKLSNGIVVNIKEEVLHEPSLKDFDQYRITKEKILPQNEPTITWNDSPIGSPENLLAISAASKAGKTSLLSVIKAGAISEDGNIDGFQPIYVKPNFERKAVLCIDPEQSEDDHQSNVNSVLKRAGIDHTPDYYREYNIRSLPFKQYKFILDNICELSSLKFGGIHLIVIDGAADFISSVNNEEEAKLIVEYFTHLSIKYHCALILVIHLNPGGDKERGHLGSEIQRKCYGLITITKKDDISTAHPKFLRKASNGDIPLLNFTYSKEKGYHVQIDAQDQEKISDKKAMTKVKIITSEVFSNIVSYNHTLAVQKIMQHTGKKETTSKNMLKDMQGWGFVVVGEDGRYRLNNESIQ